MQRRAAAALALLQPESWSQREALCRAVASALDSRDWLSLLAVLNHEQAAERCTGWRQCCWMR
jgi:DNA polymerase-3 subunit delta'